jgi:hypothetical protein
MRVYQLYDIQRKALLYGGYYVRQNMTRYVFVNKKFDCNLLKCILLKKEK